MDNPKVAIESRDRERRPRLADVAIGCATGAVAVGIRYSLPLPENVLPSFILVVAICVLTALRGVWAGASATFVGGILTWRYIYTPASWFLARDDLLGLLGFFTVACVIIATAELYRRSERRRVASQVANVEEALAQQQLFASELSHRLRNSLAIVQSIAVQTFGAETAECQKFAGRLQALAAANKLLESDINRPVANVRDVVETALSPFSHSGTFRISGPDLSLASQDVVSLTLGLHELATNAVKYGALSDPKGRVDVTWNDDCGKLHLEWKEHDGPPVKQATKQGFGSRLLRRAAMRSDLQFEPDGVRCTIRAG